MNRKDLLVMAELRNNARETLTRMSRKIHLPVSTIYERVKSHEGGLIIKHTSLIDFAKLGYNTRANLVLKVAREHREELRDYLVKHQNINSLFKINNGFDFLAEGVFRHIKEMEDFLEVLEGRFGVTEKQVYYIIDDIKRESFLSDTQLIDFFM